MKKLLLLTYSLLFIIGISYSQKRYLTNQYVYDLFQINPAAAAFHKNCITANGFFQKQWLGTELAPTTQILSFQTPLKGELGSGTNIYNDRNGFNRSIGLNQAFSYEILLKKKRKKIVSLTFGLAVNGEQTSINQNEFTTGSIIDPAITGGNEIGWGFNASSGILLKYNDLHFGLSISNILPQNNPMYKSAYEPKLLPEIHFHTGGSFKIADRDLYLEPLLMYERSSATNNRIDLNLKLYMPTPNPDFSSWGLVSYRHSIDELFGKSLSMLVTAGVAYKNFSVGIEYKLGLTTAQIDYGGAYQLIVGYRICKDKSKSAIPCSKIRKNRNHNYKFLSY